MTMQPLPSILPPQVMEHCKPKEILVLLTSFKFGLDVTNRPPDEVWGPDYVSENT